MNVIFILKWRSVLEVINNSHFSNCLKSCYLNAPSRLAVFAFYVGIIRGFRISSGLTGFAWRCLRRSCHIRQCAAHSRVYISLTSTFLINVKCTSVHGTHDKHELIESWCFPQCSKLIERTLLT